MWILDELHKRKNEYAIAVIYREKQISYRELWERSEQIASYIQRRSAAKVPVIIYGNKEIDIISVMLACLKTGRAYVPVDITFPIERLQQIIKITEAELVFDFTQSIQEEDEKYKIISPTQLKQILTCSEGVESAKNEWVGMDDNCYILFTSGSTGVPKGVQITKRNILNFVDWFGDFCNLKDGNIVMNQVSYSFDVSVIALYIYLPQGKTLFNIDKKMVDHLKELFSYLNVSEIASWVSTPAFLEICALDDSFNETLLPFLEKIILAGEILTKTLVKTVWNKFPQIEIINGYGPTEGTVLLSACTITSEMLADEKSLPIGYILKDGNFYLEKIKNEECFDNRWEGVKSGELIVISDSISKGYFKNDEQTKKCFFVKDGKRGYRTGDLVCEENGLLYYIGRKDFQIKLNGYRIEIEDISSNLNSLDYINNSLVLPVYHEGRVAYLTAFVVLRYDLGMSPLKTQACIKSDLKKKIPTYMIPRKILVLEQFPLNTNGKIDRKRLMEDYL